MTDRWEEAASKVLRHGRAKGMQETLEMICREAGVQVGEVPKRMREPGEDADEYQPTASDLEWLG